MPISTFETANPGKVDVRLTLRNETKEITYRPPSVVVEGAQLALNPASATMQADVAAGTTIATIENVPPGSTPSILPPDTRLATVGSQGAGWRVVRGLGAVTAGSVISYAVAAPGAVSVSGSVNVTATPAPSPTLGALTFSSNVFTTGTPVNGTINGATANSVLVATDLPAGLTINSAARTFAWSGVGTAVSGSFTIAENLAGATNNGRVSTINYTIGSAPSGFVAATAPVIAQTLTQITLTTAATYTGGTVATRTYDLFRNKVRIATVTLPYTKVAADYSQKLSIRETGTSGVNTAYSLSNELTDANNRVPVSNFEFAEPNGTKLRDLGWTPINGGWPGDTVEADKAIITDGRLAYSVLANISPVPAHTFPTGPGDFDIEYVLTNGSTGLIMLPKYGTESSFLLFDVESNGRIALSYTGGVLVRWKTPTALAANDVLRISVINYIARFYFNGVEYNSAGYDIISTPGNAGISIGNNATTQALMANNKMAVRGSAFRTTNCERLTIYPVGTPLAVLTAVFSATPTQRQLSVTGTYTGTPDAYLLTLTKTDGTPIIAPVDVTETITGGTFSIIHMIDESVLTAHNGQDLIVGIVQKNNTAITGSIVANLPDRNAPGVIPLVVGLNNCKSEGWSESTVARDLARRGLWVYGTGGNNFPVGKLHPTNYFPTDYDGDTSAVIKILESCQISNEGEYEITVPAGMTVAVENPVGLTATPFVGGKSTITFNSQNATTVFLALRFSGTIPAGATVTVLPKNDPNPTRKLNEHFRKTLVNNGAKWWRPMEALQTNSFHSNTIGQFTDKGSQSGVWGTTVAMAIEASRDLDINPYWCFHLHSPDAYVTAVATAMANPTTGLKIGAKVILENSNEPWNWGGGFVAFFHSRASGWEAGLDQGATAAGRTPRAPLVGYYKNSDVAAAQPFNGTTRATTRAFAANDYFMGGIVGEGVAMIFRAKRATAIGALVPTHAEGQNDDFEMVLNETLSWRLTRRYMAWRGKQMRTLFLAAWTAAGRDPNDVMLALNYQASEVNSGATVKADVDYAELTIGAQCAVTIAPYWGTSYTANYALDNVNYLDEVFMSSITDAYNDGNVPNQWKQTLSGAGIVDPNVITYEINHHMPNALFDQSNNSGSQQAHERVWAYRQDKRLGMLLKLNMSRMGNITPGMFYCIFGDASRNTWADWGIQNTMGESENPINPETRALREWNASYIAKKPTIDIYGQNELSEGVNSFYVLRTGPSELAQTVQIRVEAGASNPILTGEVTGGLNQLINVDFAANELYKLVSITTNVAADRQVKLSVEPNEFYTVGTLSAGGLTQIIKNV